MKKPELPRSSGFARSAMATKSFVRELDHTGQCIRGQDAI
jgi:hypothetical protein